MDRILVVEDRASLLKLLLEILGDRGFEPVGASTGTQAINLLKKERFSMILTDLKLPGADGIEILQEAKSLDPDIPVVIITAYGTVEVAVEAMKKGATEFLLKPVDHDYLIMLVERVLEKQRLYRENVLLKEEFARQYGFPVIVGSSPVMQTLSKDVQKVALTEVSVLLLGESGTGKELFARAVHHLSPRRSKTFVAINCAAIPDTLIENELFGHEKGAYTGASSRQMGKFELAHTGTIFLDEIGELGLNVQSKILRVLQERSFERIGGLQTIQVDVRIIAASNMDLARAVKENLFREDLYYRLSVFPVQIPPLRDRKIDIPVLADHFLKVYKQEMGKPQAVFSSQAVEKMLQYGWPGNVRELQNVIERAMILSTEDVIQPEDIQVSADHVQDYGLLDLVGRDGSLDDISTRTLAMLERELIRITLKENSEQLKTCAEKLGLTLKTLQKKISEHNL